MTGIRALLDDVGIARRRRKSWDKVFVSKELIINGAGLNDAGPADKHGHAITAFPVGGFLAAIRSSPPSG